MAEWLGRGLQNLLQRFESAFDLQVYCSVYFKEVDVWLDLCLVILKTGSDDPVFYFQNHTISTAPT